MKPPWPGLLALLQQVGQRLIDQRLQLAAFLLRETATSPRSSALTWVANFSRAGEQAWATSSIRLSSLS